MFDAVGGEAAATAAVGRWSGRGVGSIDRCPCAVDGDHVRTIDQFVGDLAAVPAFWA